VDEIPNSDHVVRHCRAARVQGDEIAAAEFELRLQQKEEYLSVNWLEGTAQPDLESQLRVVRAEIRRDLKPKDRFAKLNVGKSKQHVFQNARVRLTFRRIAEGSTHSGIFGIPQLQRINGAVALQLAQLARGNLYPATVEKHVDGPSRK
jgi:hypothetical protein